MGKPTFSWEELDSLAGPTLTHTRPADTFTLDEFAQQYGISPAMAHRRLAHLVKDGTLTRHPFLNSFHRCTYAYRIQRNGKKTK